MIRERVKTASSKIPVFDRFFILMDRLFGYGKCKNSGVSDSKTSLVRLADLCFMDFFLG